MVLSAQGQDPGCGTAVWEGGPLPQSPTLPQGRGSPATQVWEEVPARSSRGLAAVTAPCQHLPAEPAQMLQECGSATTRYCRNVNARRVGKGRAGALLPPLSPSTRQAASHALCLGRGLPPLELESPLEPGIGCKCLSLTGCKKSFFVTAPITLGWEMDDLSDTGANPVELRSI